MNSRVGQSAVSGAGASRFDVKAAFTERNPALARKLPPGTFALLRAVLHEALVNSALRRYGALGPLEFCRAVLSRLAIRVQVENAEQLGRVSAPVVCANHPTGAVEGLVLMQTLLTACGDVAVPANELLATIPSLSAVIVPIDRYRGNRQALAAYRAAFASRSPVLVFPAGRTARLRGGRLREYPWNKSFVTYARRYERPVVPVWVSGCNSPWFYFIHRARKALGIRLNLEMLLLVDELLRRRGDLVTVRFGAPRPPSELLVQDSSSMMGDQSTAESLRHDVQSLGKYLTIQPSKDTLPL